MRNPPARSPCCSPCSRRAVAATVCLRHSSHRVDRRRAAGRAPQAPEHGRPCCRDSVPVGLAHARQRSIGRIRLAPRNTSSWCRPGVNQRLTLSTKTAYPRQRYRPGNDSCYAITQQLLPQLQTALGRGPSRPTGRSLNADLHEPLVTAPAAEGRRLPAIATGAPRTTVVRWPASGLSSPPQGQELVDMGPRGAALQRSAPRRIDRAEFQGSIPTASTRQRLRAPNPARPARARHAGVHSRRGTKITSFQEGGAEPPREIIRAICSRTPL